MSKIAIIGAGNASFTRQFLNDMFTVPCMKGSTYVLMGLTLSKLEKIKMYADRLIGINNIRAEVMCTTDRRNALSRADFVILAFGVGGMEAYTYDIEIPLKYNVKQCVGDTMGPGGIFHLLRGVTVMLEIGREIEELCPDAYVLNYTNPMGAMCTALRRSTNMNVIGICNGVQSTLDVIAECTGVAKTEIDYIHAGINHMDWFLKLEHRGRNLYPVLRENMSKPDNYKKEKVRSELMFQCGYFMTETSGHLSEYLPWFRKNQKALDQYCDQPLFGGETGANLIYKKNMRKKFQNEEFSMSAKLEPRSEEYASHIIEAVVTGIPYKFSGNVENAGWITNLPQNATVEVPVCADREGYHPSYIGELPKQCAAMNLTNLIVQDMAAEAAINGNAEMVFWAVAMDPLTAAVLTLQEIREMVKEMFFAEAKWLPQFEMEIVQRW